MPLPPSLLVRSATICRHAELINKPKSKRIQMKRQSKTALITGGNSGIGLATAQLFIAEGARVAITGRNQKTLDAAAKGLGPNALAFNVDVLDSKARVVLVGTQALKAGIDPPLAG